MAGTVLRAFLWVWLGSLLLFGCSNESEQTAEASLSLQAVLGGDVEDGYTQALMPRQFSFPADHGLHPAFRNEWWYFTGNLVSATGERYGYQLTWFYTAIAPPKAATAAGELASAWSSDRIWMAHLALSDAASDKHYAFERFSRENPGLAGAQSMPFRVWLDDWQVQEVAGGDWRIQASSGELALDLQLHALKPPVLQGDAGLSRKGASPGNASYYYSMTRLETQGELKLAGEPVTVSGDSWLDREWSTSALESDQLGWDWFSLQLFDGRELMYYQLRTAAGPHPHSAGNLTDIAAVQHPISLNEMQLEPIGQWLSPDGVSYTISWRMQFEDNDWLINAIMPQQWMSLSLPYWEGAVDIQNWSDQKIIGRGYLEMVR